MSFYLRQPSLNSFLGKEINKRNKGRTARVEMAAPLELACVLVTWSKTALFRPVFIFFQFRSAAMQLQKAKNLTKNCSFSDAVGVGLPEIRNVSEITYAFGRRFLGAGCVSEIVT